MSKKNYLIVAGTFILVIIIVLGLGLPCPFFEYLNIYCAGCGTTRMILSLFKSDFYQAFRYNPLMFILLIMGICYLIYFGICKLFHLKYYKIKVRDLYLLLVILLIYMVLRNIPLFDVLKPTIVHIIKW